MKVRLERLAELNVVTRKHENKSFVTGVANFTLGKVYELTSDNKLIDDIHVPKQLEEISSCLKALQKGDFKFFSRGVYATFLIIDEECAPVETKPRPAINYDLSQIKKNVWF